MAVQPCGSAGFYLPTVWRHPREARGHFFALRALQKELCGVLLLDGDNRDLPEREIAAEGLTSQRWRCYEAESYLLRHRVGMSSPTESIYPPAASGSKTSTKPS